MNKENDEEIIENTLELNAESDNNNKGKVPLTNQKSSLNYDDNRINPMDDNINNKNINNQENNFTEENNITKEKKDTNNNNNNNLNSSVSKNVESYQTAEIESHKEIDLTSSHFPYCIVWTPIPILTYLIPCIGHTGIANSNGIIHDFAGSFFVGVDDFAFGKPTKYIKLKPSEKEKYEWDRAVEKGDNKFNMEEHNLCMNNCHSHVAYVLNQLNYKGRNNYTMVSIWWMLITKGRYVSFCGFFKTYLGFLIIVLIVIIIILIIIFV